MIQPSISVIIPTIRLDKALMALLAQLGDMDILETLIVLPNSAKPIYNFGTNCTWLTAPKGRGPQIQAGLDAAKGDILWVLHADNLLPENALSEIYRIIQNPYTAMGCFPLQFNSSSLSLKLFEVFTHLPTQLTTFGDQGFFFHREFKKDLPDLNPYPLLEDVALFRALRKKGRIKKARFPLITDVRRFRRLGTWRTQWHNIVTLWKFHKGISAKELYDDYYSEMSVPMRPATSLSGL